MRPGQQQQRRSKKEFPVFAPDTHKISFSFFYHRKFLTRSARFVPRTEETERKKWPDNFCAPFFFSMVGGAILFRPFSLIFWEAIVGTFLTAFLGNDVYISSSLSFRLTRVKWKRQKRRRGRSGKGARNGTRRKKKRERRKRMTRHPRVKGAEKEALLQLQCTNATVGITPSPPFLANRWIGLSRFRFLHLRTKREREKEPISR